MTDTKSFQVVIVFFIIEIFNKKFVHIKQKVTLPSIWQTLVHPSDTKISGALKVYLEVKKTDKLNGDYLHVATSICTNIVYF